MTTALKNGKSPYDWEVRSYFLRAREHCPNAEKFYDKKCTCKYCVAMLYLWQSKRWRRKLEFDVIEFSRSIESQQTRVDRTISKRTKNSYRFEANFAKRCSRKGWIVVPGNVLATYLLGPQDLRNAYFRKNSKLINKAINIAGLEEPLISFLEEHLCEPSDDYPDELLKVYGLPDFIILTPFDVRPFWVEVKSGSSKMSPRQRLIKSLLENIGFRVLIYLGGRISTFEKQLRNAH